MEKTEPKTPRKTGWREMLRTLSIYRWRVIACVVAFGALAACVVMLSPRQWRAEMTVMLVPQDAEENPIGEFKYDARYRLAMQLAIVRQVLLSDEVLSDVMQRVPGSSPVKGTQALDVLRKRIDIRAPAPHEFGNTEMFNLAVVDPDRNRALVMAATIKEVAERRLSELSATKARTLVRQEFDLVTGAREVVAQAQADLKQIGNRAGPDRADLQNLTNLAAFEPLLKRSIAQARTSYQDLQGKIRAEQSRLETLQRIGRKLDQLDLSALPSNLLNQDPTVQLARKRLGDLNAKLRQLRAEFTDHHPRVRAVQRELTETAQAIRKSVGAAIIAAEDDLTAMSKQVDYLAGQEQHYQARLQRIQGLQTEYTVAAEALQQDMKRWREAKQRLAMARSVESRARHSERMVYVDPPKILDRPVGPGRTATMLAGLVLGLLAGVGVALLSRQNSTLVRTESDLRRAAPDVPVLGSVRRVNRVFKTKASMNEVRRDAVNPPNKG